MSEKNPEPLPPHTYPIGIKIFFVTIIGFFFYALVLLPSHLITLNKIDQANAAFNKKEFQQAESLYQSALNVAPNSHEAIFGKAKTLFANSDPNDDEHAMVLLSTITLDEGDWAELVQIMPQEYQQYFSTVEAN
ncbi:MAG TPA: tetratricopeptide repeat protein [Patescibacteria group bacterium]